MTFKKFKLGKIAANVSILFISSSLALILFELGIRIFLPQQVTISIAPLFKFDPVLGYWHNSNINMMVNTGEGYTHFVSDEYGYRINQKRDNDPEKPDLKILATGDSFVEALSVENKDSFTGVVGRLIEAKYNKSVKVANAGISGWDPRHYYLRACRSLNEQSFDLGLIFLYVGNDCIKIKDTSHGKVLTTEPIRPRPVKESFSRKAKLFLNKHRLSLNRFLRENSHLYTLVKTQALLMLPRYGKTIRSVIPEFIVSHRDNEARAITADLCGLIAD